MNRVYTSLHEVELAGLERLDAATAAISRASSYDGVVAEAGVRGVDAVVPEAEVALGLAARP